MVDFGLLFLIKNLCSDSRVATRWAPHCFESWVPLRELTIIILVSRSIFAVFLQPSDDVPSQSEMRLSHLTKNPFRSLTFPSAVAVAVSSSMIVSLIPDLFREFSSVTIPEHWFSFYLVARLRGFVRPASAGSCYGRRYFALPRALPLHCQSPC